MAVMRPFFKVVGKPQPPGLPDGFMQGYDGAAWEWFGNLGIVLRTTGLANAVSRQGVHVESALSPLVDCWAKYSSVSLEGEKEVSRG